MAGRARNRRSEISLSGIWRVSPSENTTIDSTLHTRAGGAWTHLPARTHVWVAFHIVSVISVGLWLDAHLGWTGQHIATIWAVAVWAWLYRLGQQQERVLLIAATVISGIGEVFLSLVWGIYDYQFSNVPLFVPPGHALLMTLGLVTILHLPPRLSRPFVLLVTLIAAKWAMWVWFTDSDRFGVVLFGLYLICVAASRARNLYAAMFLLALIMELYGTALGNWIWHAKAPWLQLTAANPPFSAGAFYCALDLLVLGVWQVYAKRVAAV
jgi:hypothetical protein